MKEAGSIEMKLDNIYEDVEAVHKRGAVFLETAAATELR